MITRMLRVKIVLLFFREFLYRALVCFLYSFKLCDKLIREMFLRGKFLMKRGA